MMSNLDVERLQTRGKLRAYPDSNEPVDVEQWGMIVDTHVERLQTQEKLGAFVNSNEPVDFEHRSRKETTS